MREVEDLVTLMLVAAGESTDEELAEALHLIAVSTPSICSAFNRHVDRGLNETLKASGLKRTSLHRLATKGEFGVN